VDPGATDFTTYFRPGADTAPTDVFTPALYREAEALFETLQSRALRGAPTAG
jgi:hypothetical protein